MFQFASRSISAAADIADAVHRLTGHQVQRVAWSSIYRPAVRMVDRYRVGRVFLAGDAAHVHPPAGGQGLNTSVQDAYNLGWKLAHVARGGPDSLLDTSGITLGGLHPGDRMPDARLDDGSRLFDRLRGRHTTELVTSEEARILIRPDGYIAHIGSTHFAEYAGEPTRQILTSL